jgi:hypothetical protein
VSYQIDKHLNISAIQNELQKLAVERMGACTKKFKQGQSEIHHLLQVGDDGVWII